MAAEARRHGGSRSRHGGDSSGSVRRSASRTASPASSQPLRVAYRALRRSEEVGRLREPGADLIWLDRDALRAAMVRWVAHGNEGPESPFLHASADLEACRRLMWERLPLYQGVIVKIDLRQLPKGSVIDLSTHAAQQQWLQEETGDSEAFLNDLRSTRAFCGKDQEILILVPVPAAAISVQESYEAGPRLFPEQVRMGVCVWRGHTARVPGDWHVVAGGTRVRRSASGGRCCRGRGAALAGVGGRVVLASMECCRGCGIVRGCMGASGSEREQAEARQSTQSRRPTSWGSTSAFSQSKAAAMGWRPPAKAEPKSTPPAMPTRPPPIPEEEEGPEGTAPPAPRRAPALGLRVKSPGLPPPALPKARPKAAAPAEAAPAVASEEHAVAVEEQAVGRCVRCARDGKHF